MDTIKQTMAALLGSWALSGCLTDPNFVQVPDTQEEADLLDEGDGDNDGTAWLWPMEGGLRPVSPDMSSMPRMVFLTMEQRPTVDGPALAVVSKAPRRSARPEFGPHRKASLL